MVELLGVKSIALREEGGQGEEDELREVHGRFPLQRSISCRLSWRLTAR